MYALDKFIYGHSQAVDLLNTALQSNNLSQSLLITGGRQLGKFTLAYALAQALICQADERPCGMCTACQKMAHGNHPDVSLLTDETEALKIEAVRDLQHGLALRPHEAEVKVAILADFERATTSAANALLKTLEEPPAHAMLIITARNVDMLLPTIVSRCQQIPLKPIASGIIYTLLQEKFEASVEQATLLSRLSAGRPGWAVQAITEPEMLAQREQSLSELIALVSQNHAERLAYAQKLAKSEESIAQRLNLWLSWWRDVLMVHQAALDRVVNLDYNETLMQFAQQLSIETVVAAIRQTQKTLQNMQYNVNTRLNLEVLMLNLPRLNLQQSAYIT